MDETEAAQFLVAAKEEHDEQQKRTATSLATLHAAIVKAAQAGVRQRDIVEMTGLTRERIRQICKAAE